ncbi:hypothetical protein GOP47_0029227 [Adiantum capillus-veneris]|nr:hypothetical protein GOP47_0029227 [Adiantum capillus-veneris]
MNWSLSITRREDWWSSGGTNGWATCIVMGFLFGLYAMRSLMWPFLKRYLGRSSSNLSLTSSECASDVSSGGLPIITEADLQRLLMLLDEEGHSCGTPWIPVVDKYSDTLSYHAKLREPKDGSPTEYLSTSLFRDCSCKLLKDFYMDSEYRLGWDKTFESYELLHSDEKTGYEVGRFIRRYPFIRAREYVLAWRLWEGEDGTYYYFAKQCEHPQAPQSPLHTRVEHYMSGWRIQRDGDHCEIKMWHQEDTTSMAKMAFSYRIWNYMCDTEKSLRKYRPNTPQNTSLQLPRVPASVLRTVSCPATITSSLMRDAPAGYKKKRLLTKQSGKWMANGMLVLGGAMFCARRSAPLGAKIAALYAIKRLVKPSPSVKPIRQHYPVL